MARGEVLKSGLFWFEGLRFRDVPLPARPTVHRTAEFRINIDNLWKFKVKDGTFCPTILNDPARKARVQAHMTRISQHQPTDEPADWPPVFKNGRRLV